MTPRPQQRAIAGGLIWLGLLAGIVFLCRTVTETNPEAIGDLVTYASHQRHSIEVESGARLPLKPGDPIYRDGSDDAKPIGMVWSSKHQSDGSTRLSVVMYATCPTITSQDYLVYREAADSVDWMLRTMFHKKKQDELKGLIQEAVQENQVDLVNAFKPVVVKSLKEATGLIRDDLAAAFQKRQPQLDKLSQRYQSDVLQKKLLPVFQEEVWPIVQSESEPLVAEISREIWDEVSVFGFGWRYIYDQSPLPKKKLTEKKFKRFVEEKAKPIITAHLDEILVLQKQISAKVVKNEKVKHQRAFALANQKLDPVIRAIGMSLFGTPDGGVTPEFASVLRRRILRKDSRWLTLPLSLSLRVSTEHSAAPIKLQRSSE